MRNCEDDSEDEMNEGRSEEGNMCRACYDQGMREIRPDYWVPEDHGGSIGINAISRTDYEDVKSKRTFGVELEVCFAPKQKNMLPADKKYWVAKRDGSLPSATGVEMASTILRGDAGLNVIKNLCDYAREHKWAVDKRAGFHLHIGLNSETMKQVEAVAMGYHLTYKLWTCFVSPSRNGGRYCRAHNGSSGPKRFEEANLKGEGDFVHSLMGDRYHWVNWDSYRQRKTVEIRLHQGTLDYEKISSWVKAHLRFVDWCVSLGTKDAVGRAILAHQDCTRKAFLFLTTSVWKDRKLGGYLRKRTQKFKHGARNLPPTARTMRKEQIQIELNRSRPRSESMAGGPAATTT